MNQKFLYQLVKQKTSYQAYANQAPDTVALPFLTYEKKGFDQLKAKTLVYGEAYTYMINVVANSYSSATTITQSIITELSNFSGSITWAEGSTTYTESVDKVDIVDQDDLSNEEGIYVMQIQIRLTKIF